MSALLLVPPPQPETDQHGCRRLEKSGCLLHDPTMALRTDEADPSPFQVTIPTAEEVERYARVCLLMECLDSKLSSLAKNSHPRRRSVVGSIEEKRHRLNLDGIMRRNSNRSINGENDSLTASDNSTSDSEASSPLRMGVRRKRLASWRLPSAPRMNNGDSKAVAREGDEKATVTRQSREGDGDKAKSSSNDDMVDRLFSSVDDLVVEHCFSVTPPPETAAANATVHATVFRSDELRQLMVCYSTESSSSSSETKEKVPKRGQDRLVNAKVVELTSTYPFYDVVFAAYGAAALVSVRSSVMYAGCNPMIRVKSFAYGWTHCGGSGISQPERELAHSLPNLSIFRVENGRDVSCSDQVVGHCLRLHVGQLMGRNHNSERRVSVDRIESSRRVNVENNNSNHGNHPSSSSTASLVTAARLYKFGQDLQQSANASPLTRGAKRRGLGRAVSGAAVGGSTPALLLRNSASASLSSLRNCSQQQLQADHLLTSYIHSLEYFTLQRHSWIQAFAGEEGDGIPAPLPTPTPTTAATTNNSATDASNHDQHQKEEDYESRHIV